MQEPVTTPGQLWVAAKTEMSTLEKYLLAFKHHERLLIVLAVLAFGTFGVNRWINYESAQKDAKVVALTAVVTQDKQNVAAIAQQAATAQAAYQTTLDATTKQNVALEAAVAQESTILAQRQKADSQLSLPALGQRLEVLVPSVVGGVQSTPSGVSLTPTATSGIVSALEEVPILTDQLAKETQLEQNKDLLLADADKVIDADGAEISALNKTLADSGKQCQAEVAAEKVKTKKAFMKGLKMGFLAGFAAGAYVVHAL